MNDTVPNPPDVTAPIRDQLNDLSALLALWARRGENSEIGVSRAAAGNALDAIDALLTGVHTLRSWLVDDIQEYDARTAAETDELLERLRREHGITPLPDEDDRLEGAPSNQAERPWIDGGSAGGWSPDPDDN